MSLQNYKNSTSFDQRPANSHNGVTTLDAGQLNRSADQSGIQSGIHFNDQFGNSSNDRPDQPTGQSTVPNDSLQKPSSFTSLIKSKFKRAKSNHKLKGKKSKEQNSMVRSISIAFNDDAYASQKSQPTRNLESISNLYLNEARSNLLNDSNRSNISNSSTNNDSKSTVDEHRRAKKSNKLQKLREKLRNKFKLKANSLEDRSATDLDDSLEQPSDEVDERNNGPDGEQIVDSIAGQRTGRFNGDLPASERILDLFDADLDALSSRTKASLKLRPKSEVFAGQQLRNLNKNHRFTTIEVSAFVVVFECLPKKNIF